MTQSAAPGASAPTDGQRQAVYVALKTGVNYLASAMDWLALFDPSLAKALHDSHLEPLFNMAEGYKTAG
jgi:hypothetical protein